MNNGKKIEINVSRTTTKNELKKMNERERDRDIKVVYLLLI